MVLYVGDPATWSATGNLPRAVHTGESAFALTHGMPLDAYLPRHPDLSARFNGWMTRQSGLHNAALVAAYDFSTAHTVVDVGGGQGANLSVSKDFDARMLVQREAGAGIRTEAEFDQVCRAADPRLVRVLPTTSPHSILEAVRA